MTQPRFYRLPGAAAAIAIAIALSACGQKPADSQVANTALPELPATLPLAAGPESLWPFAPAVSSLPPSAPLRAVRVANPGEYYGYADAAYDFQDALGDAPPDYYFDYGDVDPWAWEGYDQSLVFVEPIDDDGYRYYYYRPGADRPYFVRDPYYSYGYDGDALAVIYDSFGAVVPYADYGPRADYAARYYVRGRGMFAASRRAERRAVVAADWAARSPSFERVQDRWTASRDRQPQWRDFRKHGDVQRVNYWREESTRRQSDTRRFAQWQSQGFRNAAPPRAIPQAWTKARWTGDQKRFLPARAERVQAAARPDRRQGLMAAPENRRDFRGETKVQALASPPPDRGRPAFENGRRSMPNDGARPAGELRRGFAAARPERQEGRGNGRKQFTPPPVQSQPVEARPDRGNRQHVERLQQAETPRPQRFDGNGKANRGGGHERLQFRTQEPQPQAQPQAQPQPRPDRGGGNRHGGGRALSESAPRQMEAPRPQPQAAPGNPHGNGDGGRKGGGGGNGGGKHDRGGH